MQKEEESERKSGKRRVTESKREREKIRVIERERKRRLSEREKGMDIVCISRTIS